jgi:hypothetical protein
MIPQLLFLPSFCLALTPEDLFSSPKYQIELKPNLVDFNFQSERFQCFIPPPLITEKELNLNDLIEKLKTMPCLYHVVESRYWSYEFCSMKHAQQFHPLSQTEAKYLLGTYAKQTAQKLEYEVIDGAKQPVLIQEWSGGTMCDLSLTNRRSRIEYHCATEERVVVRETTSCNYLFLVSTPRVCVGLNNVLVIKCSVLGEGHLSHRKSIESLSDNRVDLQRSVMKQGTERTSLKGIVLS